ncbi:MAG TPA: mechanosensitive ion channel, partial [Pontiellaceae bacterium]|nr:mechanosensitive ion channel [Pontiellaceae bacterium]
METNAMQNAVNGVQQMFNNTPEWVTTAQAMLTAFGLKLVAAILIFVIGRWIAKMVQNGLEKGMLKAKVDQVLVTFTVNMAYTALMVFVALAALGQLGVQTTSFIAVLGAAGLAVGLALQGSLSNFASGVMIIIFRPFKIGDYVEGGGTGGTVKAIHIFTTTLTTGDNKRVIVPNSKMMGDNIINYSAEGTRRLDLTASIGYGDSIDKAKAVLQDILAKEPRVLKDPAPFVGVSKLAESSVDFTVRPWVQSADYWPVCFDLNEAIKKRFDAEGLSIPFPQRDVHLYKH